MAMTRQYGLKRWFQGQVYGKVTTQKGVIYYMYLNRNTRFSGSTTEAKDTTPLKKYHYMLGYRNKD